MKRTHTHAPWFALIAGALLASIGSAQEPALAGAYPSIDKAASGITCNGDRTLTVHVEVDDGDGDLERVEAWVLRHELPGCSDVAEWTKVIDDTFPYTTEWNATVTVDCVEDRLYSVFILATDDPNQTDSAELDCCKCSNLATVPVLPSWALVAMIVLFLAGGIALARTRRAGARTDR